MIEKSEYYVYVYIDPRNFEEFYFGKGKGSRKEEHLTDTSDSEKTKRIKEIHDAGLSPIIKVIAKELNESQAFLVEKTLIWKLGKTLTNKSSGHFAEKFRPHNTLHLNLNHFDFKNGIFYVNVGEGETRSWEDCAAYNFLAAGQDPKWSDQIRALDIGDVVVAYLKGRGYVGIGKVVKKAIPVIEFRHSDKPLKELPLAETRLFTNADTINTEYLLTVNWVSKVKAKEAKWKSNHGLFTTQLIKASLQHQSKTITFLEQEFGLSFSDLLN